MKLPESAQLFFDKVLTRLTAIQNRYALIKGDSGGLLFSEGEGDLEITFDSPIKMSPALVSTQSEADLTMGFSESFQFVFDNWMRISRSSSGTWNETGDRWSLTANYAETQSWLYDDVNDRIYSTVNSATLIGFISPLPLENYTVEVILRSEGNDDDFIGLCIALAYDNLGRARTLDVMRGLNGNAPITVATDRGISSTTVASMGAPLKWPNGNVATEPLGGNHVDEDHPGWLGFPDGVKLKVTRAGNIITIETSDLFDPDNYVEDAKVVIDLNSTATLRLFRGPCQWGYVAQSQDQATWEILQRPVERDLVYNVATNTLHHWDNTAWTTTENVSLPDVLTAGRLYYNQSLNRLDYYDPDDLELVPINTGA